jgi:Rnl2 family RNA ligase
MTTKKETNIIKKIDPEKVDIGLDKEEPYDEDCDGKWTEDFTKWGKTHQAHNHKHIARLHRDYGHKTWIAKEKGHGTNVTFFMTKGSHHLRIGRRNGELLEDERSKFYHIDTLMDRDEGKFVDAIKEIRKNKKKPHVQITGELLGGLWPNEKGKLVTNGAVQLEVLYSKYIHFIVFDMSVDHVALPYGQTIAICKKTSLVYMKPSHTGTLEEMLALDEKFISMIPTYFGDKSPEDNWAEGWIIATEYPCDNGRRCFVKKKYIGYKEQKLTVIKEKVDDPSWLQAVAATFTDRDAANNRLNTVLSKDSLLKPPLGLSDKKMADWIYEQTSRLTGRVMSDTVVSFLEFLENHPQTEKVMMYIEVKNEGTPEKTYILKKDVKKKISKCLFQPMFKIAKKKVIELAGKD